MPIMKEPETKEQPIGSFVQKYNISDAAIQEMKDNFLVLTVDGFNDAEGYDKVKKARIVVKTKRVEVERKRIELKDESIKYGRAVDAEAKRITALLLPIEQHLTTQQDIIDKENERIKKVKDELERKRIQDMVDELMKYNIVRSFQEIQEMNQDQYNGLLMEAISDHAEKKRIKESEDNARKKEEDRLNTIKAEQELERKKLEAEKEEQTKRENAIKAEQEKIVKAQQDIENQKQKIKDDEKRKAELEEAKKEAARKTLIEAKEIEDNKKEFAIKAEEDRIAEIKRQEEIKPDKEKLLSFIHSIEIMVVPVLKSPVSIKMADSIVSDIRELCNKSRTYISTL